MSNPKIVRSDVSLFSVSTALWRKSNFLFRFPITDMNVRRRHVGVVAAHGRLFAIGGHDGERHLQSAESFDPETNRWAPVAAMHVQRRGIAVGALEGAVYAVGGLDDTTCFQVRFRWLMGARRIE